MAKQFRLIVWPDTQYLFDGSRIRDDYIRNTLEELAADDLHPPAAFLHVGDVVEHGSVEECASAAQAFDCRGTELSKVPWLWISGNHDVSQSDYVNGKDSPFKQFFGANFTGCKPQMLWSPDGYSWVAQLDSQKITIIGVGYGADVETLNWLQKQGQSDFATILICHDVAFSSDLTSYGLQLWDILIDPLKSIFLVIAGHEWPSSRIVRSRRDGSKVEIHVVNYQDCYAGGAGMIREYLFYPNHHSCEVKTWCPSLNRDPSLNKNIQARIQLTAANENNQFRFNLPASLDNSHDRPWQIPSSANLVFTTNTTGNFYLPKLNDHAIALYAKLQLPKQNYSWQTIVARYGQAPDGSDEPLASLSISSEGFIGWHMFHTAGQAWATSHAIDLGSCVEIIVVTAERSGMWINGDEIFRSSFSPRSKEKSINDTQQIFNLTTTPVEEWHVGAYKLNNKIIERFHGIIEKLMIWQL